MTNRQRYITQCSEYDLMIRIMCSGACPINAVMGVKSCPVNYVCKVLYMEKDCPPCIQRWLNRKENEDA